MKTTALLVAVVAISSMFAPAGAQNARAPEVSALNHALYGKANYDDAWRRSVASAMLAWCEDVRHRIPRNTPAEDQWVDAEYADAVRAWADDNKRMDRVEKSVEFARQHLSIAFSKCSSSAKSIQDGQKSRRDEALLWIDLIWLLGESDEIQRLAIIVGFLPRNFSPLNSGALSHGQDNEDEIGLSSMAGLKSGITLHALIPLVKGE